MKPYLFFLFIFVTIFCAWPKSQTMHIDRDTVLTGNFEVPDSLTCTIKAGTTIKFACYCKFIVRGLLIAQGTAREPITFTCVDRSHGATQPPCWYGMLVMGKSSQADFRNCRFEGMYRALVWDCRPLFDSCEFAGNHFALYCTKKASPLVKNCRFYRNVYGIVADFATPLLRNNLITDNTIGVYLQVGSQPLAGPNTIFGNQTNIRVETALAGDSTAFSMKYLWELMNELY
jgi:parallel beta-helix repeat protein